MAKNTDAPTAADPAAVVVPAPEAPAVVTTSMMDTSMIMSVQGEMVAGPGKTVKVKTAFGHELSVKTN